VKWLITFVRSHAALTALAVDLVREQGVLRRRIADLTGSLAAANARIAGQHVEAARMSQAVADAETERDAAKRQLGRYLMTNDGAPK
jgi:hypothetical protein